MPQNVIENIENRTIKVNRKLKRAFKSKEELQAKIKSEIQADANGNVSVDQLRDFVLGLCEEELMGRKLVKRDIEGFLSAFNYNAYGATNVNEISTLIFTSDDQIPHRLAERKRANPPPSEVNADIVTSDLKETDLHNHRIRKLFTEVETKVFRGKLKQFEIFKKFDSD